MPLLGNVHCTNSPGQEGIHLSKCSSLSTALHSTRLSPLSSSLSFVISGCILRSATAYLTCWWAGFRWWELEATSLILNTGALQGCVLRYIWLCCWAQLQRHLNVCRQPNHLGCYQRQWYNMPTKRSCSWPAGARLATSLSRSAKLKGWFWPLGDSRGLSIHIGDLRWKRSAVSSS